MTFLGFDSTVNSLTYFVVRAAFGTNSTKAQDSAWREKAVKATCFGEGSCFLMKELLNSYVEIFSGGRNFLVQEDQGAR